MTLRFWFRRKAVILLQDKIPLLILLSVGAAFTAVWLALLRKRLNMAWYVAIMIAIAHTVYGVLTVKAFAFLETGFDKASLGNMSLFGGMFLMPLAYWLGAKISKRPLKEVFDVFTPCMVFTVMCARVNCILSGCCRGLPIPGTNGIRFPTREAETVFSLVLLAVLCPRIWKERLQGRAYPVYMMCYGAFRFIIEFFRESDISGLFHRAHLWALITLLLGVSIYAEMKTSKSKPRRRKQS